MSLAVRLLVLGALAAYLYLLRRLMLRNPEQPVSLVRDLSRLDQQRVTNAVLIGRRVSKPDLAPYAVRVARRVKSTTFREAAGLVLAVVPMFVGLAVALTPSNATPRLWLVFSAFVGIAILGSVSILPLTLKWTRRMAARAEELNQETIDHPDGPLTPEPPLMTSRVKAIFVFLGGLQALVFIVRLTERGSTAALLGLGRAAVLVAIFLVLFRLR